MFPKGLGMPASHLDDQIMHSQQVAAFHGFLSAGFKQMFKVFTFEHKKSPGLIESKIIFIVEAVICLTTFYKI